MRPEAKRGGEDAFADAAMDWHIALSEAAEGERPHPDRLLQEFRAWLAQDSRHGRAWEELTGLLASPDLRAASLADAARLPPLPKPRTAGRAFRKGRFLPRLALASMVTALVAGLWIALPGLLLRWQADILTTAGELRVLTLPDGSRADLNSNTALALDFAEGRRHIRLLQGEVWFDVIHDPAHPFIVDAGETEVTVKGTAFAMRAIEGEEFVLLERGSVQVVRGADQFLLRPGQMVEISPGITPEPLPAELDRALAWREGWVLMKEQPFPKALAELQRHYPGRVIDLSAAGDRLVSGSFRTDDAEAAIRSIAAASGVTVSRMPGGLLILR